MIKNWLVRWVANILGLFVVTAVVPGITLEWQKNPLALIIVVVALSLANAVIRPIIMLFAWPINCLTFGLFGFALNVMFFWAVGSGMIVKEFRVSGAVSALIGSAALGAISAVISFFLKDRGDRDS